MKYKNKVPFKAPLKPKDTELQTEGCRQNNPDICKNNGIPELCAFEREDGMCLKPSAAWKKQFYKLKEES